MSKIRDHDLKTNIEAKVQRLGRSLSRPKRDEGSARSGVYRSTSFGRRQEDVDSDVRSDNWRHRLPSHSDVHSSAVLMTQPPYALEKLPESSTSLQRTTTRVLLKDAFDRDSLPTGRSFDRITSILEQLRRQDAGPGGGGGLAVTSRRHDNDHPSSVRAELDSFAALISKLSPGSAAGLAGHRTSGRSDAEDFWTRLAHTRTDLTHLDTLVKRTFGSSPHVVVSNSPPPSVSVEPVFIFHYKRPSSRRDDVLSFVAGEHADYKKSDAMAEVAIKWAQERRQKIENELHQDREYEDHPGYRQTRSHIARHAHEDEYLEPDELEPVSAAVIHTSPTMRYHRAATVDLHGTSPREASTMHSYTRSASAAVTGLHPRADEQSASHWHPTRTITLRPPMSAARQRARSVLAKHGRRLSRD